ENFILCAIGVGNFHLLGQNFSSYMQIRGLKVPSVRGKNFNLCANRQGKNRDTVMLRVEVSEALRNRLKAQSARMKITMGELVSYSTSSFLNY
ncbi:MAG TPA: hypothetical protein V6D26_17290, partial [Stenomitos sp.]